MHGASHKLYSFVEVFPPLVMMMSEFQWLFDRSYHSRYREESLFRRHARPNHSSASLTSMSAAYVNRRVSISASQFPRLQAHARSLHGVQRYRGLSPVFLAIRVVINFGRLFFLSAIEFIIKRWVFLSSLAPPTHTKNSILVNIVSQSTIFYAIVNCTGNRTSDENPLAKLDEIEG